MKLILQESITGLGNPGDLVQVKSGYGRNYLLPSGKAIIANEENMKQPINVTFFQLSDKH